MCQKDGTEIEITVALEEWSLLLFSWPHSAHRNSVSWPGIEFWQWNFEILTTRLPENSQNLLSLC